MAMKVRSDSLQTTHLNREPKHYDREIMGGSREFWANFGTVSFILQFFTTGILGGVGFWSLITYGVSLPQLLDCFAGLAFIASVFFRWPFCSSGSMGMYPNDMGHGRR